MKEIRGIDSQDQFVVREKRRLLMQPAGLKAGSGRNIVDMRNAWLSFREAPRTEEFMYPKRYFLR